MLFKHIFAITFIIYALPALSLSNKWSGAEHTDLGNLGYNKACQKSSVVCPKQIARADGMNFNYGQVLTMGDFYLDIDEAFEDRLNYIGLNKIFKCIDKQGKVHQEQLSHPEVSYPSCDWTVITNKLDYLKVVSNNFEHFAWDNVRAYIKYHQTAIDMALKSFAYREMEMPDIAQELLNKALFYNAFADHFLTDSFPAGHLRVPRREISKWAQANLRGPFKKSRADALAALFHNIEGFDLFTKTYHGLKVRNSLGQRWTTDNDERLHTNLSKNPLKKSIIVDAVNASLLEVLQAAAGQQPTGVFSATHYLPIPLEEINDLYGQKQFVKLKTIKLMKKQLPTALKLIVSTSDIKKIIQSFPKINSDFKKRVQLEINTDPSLRQKVASTYLDYFLN